METQTFDDWADTQLFPDTADASQIDLLVRAAYAAGVASAEKEAALQQPVSLEFLRLRNFRHPRESDAQHAQNELCVSVRNTVLDRIKELGDLYTKPCAPAKCPGVPRQGCNYLSQCRSICTKCGSVHSTMTMPEAWNAKTIAATAAANTLDDAVSRLATEIAVHSLLEQRDIVKRLADGVLHRFANQGHFKFFEDN